MEEDKQYLDDGWTGEIKAPPRGPFFTAHAHTIKHDERLTGY